jgi:hypothetical protein
VNNGGAPLAPGPNLPPGASSIGNGLGGKRLIRTAEWLRAIADDLEDYGRRLMAAADDRDDQGPGGV